MTDRSTELVAVDAGPFDTELEALKDALVKAPEGFVTGQDQATGKWYWGQEISGSKLVQ